jgi:hypothetical protein
MHLMIKTTLNPTDYDSELVYLCMHNLCTHTYIYICYLAP